MSFLDVRMLSCPSIRTLDDAIIASRVVDDCCGVELNMRQTRWSFTAHRRPILGLAHAVFRYVSSLKYIGLDVILQGAATSSPKPRALARCVLARKRARLITLVPGH